MWNPRDLELQVDDLLSTRAPQLGYFHDGDEVLVTPRVYESVRARVVEVRDADHSLLVQFEGEDYDSPLAGHVVPNSWCRLWPIDPAGVFEAGDLGVDGAAKAR